MTSLWRALIGWTFRHLIALVLILLILIAGRYALPPALDWVQAQREAASAVATQRSAIREAQARFEAWAEASRAEAEGAADRLSRLPEAQLRARRADIEPAIAARRPLRLGTGQLALAAMQGDSDRLFAHYRAGAEIGLLERERRILDSLLAERDAEARRLDLAGRRQAAVAQLRASHARFQAASARAETLQRRPLAGPRNFVCRAARPPAGCDNYRALVAARAERDAALAANRQAQRTIEAIDRADAAGRAAATAIATAAETLDAERREMDARLEALERTAGGNWILWIRQPVVEMLPTALLILAGAMLGPMLVKAFLYFVVAPMAARRPPIRLLPGEGGEVAMQGPSAVSQRVALVPGTELLLLPEAVQSTPHGAAKRTQWLLDWRMPFTSLAAGMAALIRLRSRESDFVLVSATGSPLAEVALVSVAEGSAIVLRPRALRGLVRPSGEPLRITRRWRLLSLSAWLTFQFRYLLFHGPCTLVVEGTRGVRLEPAGPGRGINQAATIGFSAGLAYSVRRSEAFGAYLLGRQELFNDSFEDAGGWYLYEEMPREGQGGGPWGRGLRGLGDAFLKLFGI